MNKRLSSGLNALDDILGGGFLPGSMVMIVGATGVGKTQLGMSFVQQGLQSESARGAIIDLSSRGDSQNHSGYLSDCLAISFRSSGQINLLIDHR